MTYENRLKQFINVVQRFIDEEYKKNFNNLIPPTLVVREGMKFDKIVVANASHPKGESVWGFVAKSDFIFKGTMLNTGDLMKAATWSAPAKHARANIFYSLYEGYGIYGPVYLAGYTNDKFNVARADDSSLDETVIVVKRTRAKKGEKTKAQLKEEAAQKRAEWACNPKSETYWAS